MDVLVSIVVIIIFDEGRHLLCFDDFHNLVFKVLRPHTNWQLRDRNLVIACLPCDATEFVTIRTHGSDRPLEIPEPWCHDVHLLAFHQQLKIFNDVLRIIVRYARTPSGADTVCAIDQHHGHHRHIHLRLDSMLIVSIVREQWLIRSVEDFPSKWRKPSIDVTSACTIATTLKTTSKITARLKAVDVV